MGIILQVGRYYRNRIGDLNEIVGELPEDHPSRKYGATFIGNGNLYYLPDGSQHLPGSHPRFTDLVEEATAEEVRDLEKDIFHPEIPIDDYEAIRCKQLGLVPKFFGKIGPHEFRSRNLMVAKLKPCALIDRKDLNYDWDNLAKENNWFISNVTGNRLAITLPEQTWRSDALLVLFKQGRAHGEQIFDRVLGGLLGYRQSDIDEFIKRAERIAQFRKSLGGA